MNRRSLAVAVTTLMFVACSSPSTDPGQGATGRSPREGATGATPDARDPSGPTSATGARVGSTGATGTAGHQTLLPKDGSFVVLGKDRYTPMWHEPGRGAQPDFAMDTYNDYDQSVPMLIEHATMRDGEPWYEVLLPIRPNGSSAWVRGSDVKIRGREDRLEVDLSDRTLRHYRGDELVDRFHVGIGTDQYPTTEGQFYVYIKVPYDDPNQPYGIMALGLSGFSKVITDWPGGGRIAVHGTPYASDRAQAVSHGCVRVYNADMEHLTDLPLGTPVEIHA